jgi:hypothetical protein
MRIVLDYAPYDVNGNGCLDVWTAGVPIPAGEVNEAFLLGLGTTWPELEGRIIYVSYPIRVNGDGSLAQGMYYSTKNVTILCRQNSPAGDEGVLAHELGHACNLNHVYNLPGNQKYVMKGGVDAKKDFFGYFRVRRADETGVTPGFDDQWNKVIR